MAGRNNLLSRIRLVYRRSSLLLKCVVLAMIVLSVAALSALGAAIHNTRAQTEALRAQAAYLEQENQRMQASIAELGTVQSVKRIAAEKLGLVDPDTIIFNPVESTEP